MGPIHTVDEAIAGQIAVTDDGWVAVALCSPDTDGEFLAELGRVTAKPRPGTSLAAWSEAFCAAQMSLRQIVCERGSSKAAVLSEAPAIYGPAVVGGASPAVAWVESDRAEWKLCAHEQGRTRILVRSPNPLRNPTLVRDATGRLWAAYDCHERGADRIHVLATGGGVAEHVVEGRCPTLAHVGGSLWLASERRKRQGAEISLVRFDPLGEPRHEVAASPHPWNFLPHLFAQSGSLMLAWESTPGFAPDDRQAFYREIQIRQIDVDTGRIHLAPNLPGGAAPIEVEAFEDRSIFNNVPVRPRLFGNRAETWLAYRFFRFRGRYCFGWDLLAIPVSTATPPRRPIPRALTSGIGFPDTPYGVCLTDEGRVLVAAHCMSQEPPREDVPWTARKAVHSAREHRLEICACGVDDLSPPGDRGYAPLPPLIPPSLTDHCPEPPDLLKGPDGLRLVWGDLHGHSCYSKCMPCNDGTPEDVLRYQRDVLGCQVLALTDHIEYVSAPEFRLLADDLAAEASDQVVVLYGAEWAKHPAHDTNFFACEREVFDRLRGILLAESHISQVFDHMEAELPPDSVVAIRHFHGRRGEPHGIDGSEMAATYDATFERAMEVVQTRGDMMVNPPAPCPPFPTGFLQAGADIGLVGGSDHSRGGPLKFGLTGFWVRELTSQSVLAALRQRRTMACASGKLKLWAELSGDTVDIAVSSPTPLKNVALWCDGRWTVIDGQGHRQSTMAFDLALHRADRAAQPLVIRAEARPAHPGWPSVVGYMRPAAPAHEVE